MSRADCVQTREPFALLGRSDVKRNLVDAPREPRLRADADPLSHWGLIVDPDVRRLVRREDVRRVFSIRQVKSSVTVTGPDGSALR